MPIQARVKSNGPAWPVTTCGGRATFIKSEWRDVPAGFEEEAAKVYFLEVRSQDDILDPEIQPEIEADHEKPKAKRKGGGSL